MNRVLLNKKLDDRARNKDLADKTRLPTVNEVTVRQSAVWAWRAVREAGSPLAPLLRPSGDRTRSATAGLMQPATMRCHAARNLSTTWNHSEELRHAVTLSAAKRVATRLASEHRFRGL